MTRNSKNELTDNEKRIIINKGTEMPFTGKYNNFKEKGTYICKQCGSSLYNSTDKFSSNCGWPSFDDEIENAVKRIPDSDGKRTEIVCAECDAHLGHVFLNEGFTQNNMRHCVNSISLDFVPEKEKFKTAIFAGGCFWGVEHFFKKQKGVISVESEYIGGSIEDPNYEIICTGMSGHAEAVQVVFDPSLTNFEILASFFFEIHDPSQLNYQGPDFGEQYRSEVFYTNENQKNIANKLIKILQNNGYNVVTKVTPAAEFYVAEDYHQNYYERNGALPYCHVYTKRF